MALKSYDFKKVSLIVGPHAISGFAKGSAIKIGRNADSWTEEVGADGEVVRSKLNDFTGKLVFTLQQTSPSNAILSALSATDEQSGAGVVPVLVKDGSPNGTSIHAASQAYLKKPADADYDNEAKTREWTVFLVDLDQYIGGN